jgi:uncharacterized protein
MRTVAVVGGVLAGIWLLVVVLAWGFQRHLVYLPDRADPGAPPPDVEEVALTTVDGLELTAWFLPRDAVAAAGAAGGGRSGGAGGAILVTPGNAGNRELRLPLARGLAQRGHDVLLVEYRGYGGNPGSPGEEGLARDAVAAWEHLVARDGVGPERVVVLGESIGTGVAAGLVGGVAGGAGPAGVALRSPFPSLADVAGDHYPFLPVRWLLRERFPVLEDLARVDLPVLVVAGGADTIVGTDRSREVAEAIGARYVELAGVDHNDRALLDGADYLDAVDRFVREVTDPS